MKGVLLGMLLLMPAAFALTLNDGVELYYSFDNGSVNTTHVLDTVQGHHGTLLSAVTQVASESHDASRFNGSYVVVPAFDFGDAFTICTTVRLSAWEHALVSTYGSNFSRVGGAFELFFNTYDASPQLGVILDNDDSFIEIDTLDLDIAADGTWRFICASYDGGTTSRAFQLFYNGVLMTNISDLSQGEYGGGYNRTMDLVIGAGNPDGMFKAVDMEQDSFMVYKNRVLTESDVAELYERLQAGENYPFS